LKTAGKTHTRHRRAKIKHQRPAMRSPSEEAVKEAINEVEEGATKEAVRNNEEAEGVVASKEDEEDRLELATTLDTWDVLETLVDAQLLLKTRTCGFIWSSF
jgi:hypothetical protein